MLDTERIMHYATGGTADSVWSPQDDTAVAKKETEVGRYFDELESLNYPGVDTETLLLKDSRNISVQERREIAQRVAETRRRRVIVTSGTFLMPEIGRHIARHGNRVHFDRGEIDKRVTVTGALKPLDGFMMPDAGFNLGMSAAVLEEDTIDERVMAVVNGGAVPAENLEKDQSTAVFSSYELEDDRLGYDRFLLVPAGGSIDFEVGLMDNLQPAAESAIPGFLRSDVKIVKNFDATPPILKDSRDLTPGDIDNVVEMIKSTTDGHVIVTAGLIRIGELRKELKRGLHSRNDRERRVIVTGSRMMLRMAGRSHISRHSDAPYALGYTLGKIGFVDPGVHVAVGGRVINAKDDPIHHAYTDAELKQLRLDT